MFKEIRPQIAFVGEFQNYGSWPTATLRESFKEHQNDLTGFGTYQSVTCLGPPAADIFRMAVRRR